MDKKRIEGRRPATPIISRRRGLIVAGGIGRRRAGTTQRSHPTPRYDSQATASREVLGEKGESGVGPGGQLVVGEFGCGTGAVHLTCPVMGTHVVGGFLFGQVHAKVSATAFQEAREFLDSFEVLHPDSGTAAIYGRLRAQLLASGIRLPDPDYWIAAHAWEGRLPLLSTDRDFEHIAELVFHHVTRSG